MPITNCKRQRRQEYRKRWACRQIIKLRKKEIKEEDVTKEGIFTKIKQALTEKNCINTSLRIDIHDRENSSNEQAAACNRDNQSMNVQYVKTEDTERSPTSNKQLSEDETQSGSSIIWWPLLFASGLLHSFSQVISFSILL